MKRLTALLLLAVILVVPLLLTSCRWSYFSFEYELTEDGTGYRIVDYMGSYTDVIDFPASHKNKPVKEIGGKFFYFADEIRIPATVERIADRLIVEGDLVFDKISVDPDNPNYCSIDGNLYTKDGSCLLRYGERRQDAAFTVPDTVTRIGHYAFHSAYWLEKLTLPETVTRIDEYAFFGCDSLKQISVPDTLETIGYGAFLRCDALQYNTSENCYWLGNEENLGVVLVKVKEDRRDLTALVLDEGVRIVSYAAFFGCDKLETVHLPDSLVGIGDSAFDNCTALAGVSLKAPDGWRVGDTLLPPTALADPAQAAAYLSDTYCHREWMRK